MILFAMDLKPFQASIQEVRSERARVTTELHGAQKRVADLTAKLARLDRMAQDIDALLHEAQTDTVTQNLPMAGAEGVAAMTMVGVALGTAIRDSIQEHQKRSRDRNSQIVEVLETGPADWDLATIVEELTRRGNAKGLTQPNDAIRVALDRMVKKGQGVVKMAPGRYRLRSRLAPEQAPAKAIAVGVPRGVIL